MDEPKPDAEGLYECPECHWGCTQLVNVALVDEPKRLVCSACAVTEEFPSVVGMGEPA